MLKEIIQHLHAGAALDLVKEQLRKIVGETDATEIMGMEQQLIAEGIAGRGDSWHTKAIENGLNSEWISRVFCPSKVVGTNEDLGTLRGLNLSRPQ